MPGHDEQKHCARDPCGRISRTQTHCKSFAWRGLSGVIIKTAR